MPFTASADQTSGDLIAVGDLVGVVMEDVASGDTGMLLIGGVVEVGMEAELIAQGVSLYLNATNGTVTTTKSTNKFVGYAWIGAAATETKAQVKLLF